MNEDRDPSEPSRAGARGLYAVVAIVWAAAAITWWSVLWHGHALRAFGADLPQATALVLALARAGVPFGVAAVLSLVVVRRLVRPGRHPARVAAAVLAVALACTAATMAAVTLPFVTLCGSLVPPEPAVAAGGCGR